MRKEREHMAEILIATRGMQSTAEAVEDAARVIRAEQRRAIMELLWWQLNEQKSITTAQFDEANLDALLDGEG